MMGEHSRTINLTRINEGNYYENVLKKNFTYDEDIRRKVNVKREFLEQKHIAEALHNQRFIELISDVIENVEKFVSKSLQLDRPGLFERQKDEIHAETLLLDMHVSDHEMTFAMIEKSIKRLVTNLHVSRLKANLARKRGIQELIESSEQSEIVFIIVEQAECLSRSLTETLVGHLRSRLSNRASTTDVVMILFCLSIRLQILPFDHMRCFKGMKGITKLSRDSFQDRLDVLLRSRDLKVKLAPATLDLIYLHSLYADASITNISYLHCYCIFEHYKRLDEKSILTEKEYKKLERKHQSLCDDLQCYALFLYDLDTWPQDASDLYEELGRLDDLSQSTEFFNAIHRIKKIPHDRLVGRLEMIAKQFTDHKQQAKRNAPSILLSYKEKIANDKGEKHTVSELLDDLMKYARTIKCPFSKHPNFYFSDCQTLIRGCLKPARSQRELLQSGYLDESTFFGVLLNKVLSSPRLMAANELFDEVLTDFKELISTHKTEQSSESLQPRREHAEYSNEEMDGLVRALFIDTIDSMEHQGLVKLDPRSKGKVIKRLAWPRTDE